MRADEAVKNLDLGTWETLAVEVEPYLLDAGRKGAKHILAQIVQADEGLFDQVDPIVVKYASERSAELVGMRQLADGRLVKNPNAEWAISDSTRDMLKGSVKSAFEDGLTKEQLASRIMASEGFNEDRALNIARTELSMANSYGNKQAIKETGLEVEKSWLVSNDPTVCEDCQDNADAGWIPMDENYPSGDDSYPAHPSCQCDEIFREVGGKE